MCRNYLLVMLAIVVGGCSKSDSAGPASSSNETVVTIHVQDKKQTIHNFGASDAWACQYIGLWPDEKRNQVANWLFSTETDAAGKPAGIGLSLWRFNIGAGSAAQDNISDEWRRAEGFMKDDKTYDWSRQAGQQWFMQAAQQRGVSQFLAFTNSPPVQLTKNGKAFSSDGGHANISATNYKAFAVFLADIVKHFQSQGITLNYLSPFNEPQWDWTSNGQEGTPYTNQEIVDITKKLDSVLTAYSLSTRIQIGEAAKMNYLYEESDKPTRGNQIKDFFGNTSSHYIGDLSHVDKMISAHSYFTSAPMETMIQVRKNIANAISQASIPLEFWQSEYCILGDQEEIPGGGKDTGMTTALYVARLIHHDLTVANASAWQWWTAISVYDYKDGLIYADKNKTNGNIEDTKLLWALGNYSRFIRPGAVRVSVTSDTNINNTKGLMISSYIHETDKKLVTVIVNYSNIDSVIQLAVDGAKTGPIKPYITSAQADEDLKPLADVAADQSITIPRNAVVTLVSDMVE
ncbi:MAG TPA: glycoside hydrolase [Ohtaekwangia sp.]|uniref:glycoside hydrolase n=1 Tax=Ohtaekwangia sp. TaxID=2066019 RepID=UPI002F949931